MMVVSKAKNKRATEAQISHHRIAEEAGNLENKQAEQWISLRSYKEKTSTPHSSVWVPSWSCYLQIEAYIFIDIYFSNKSPICQS